MKRPPGHVENAKNWDLLMSESLNIRTEDPFGAYPYLWMSALIDVTPSTRKSQGLMVPGLYISIKGRM